MNKEGHIGIVSNTQKPINKGSDSLTQQTFMKRSGTNDRGFYLASAGNSLLNKSSDLTPGLVATPSKNNGSNIGDYDVNPNTRIYYTGQL
jgi:hypothetical protein